MKLKELKCIDKNIDLDQYIEFRETVRKNMEHPDWLGSFSKEDLITMLNNNSKIWIFYLNDDPVCSTMIIPASEKSLAKFDLNLDCCEVVDYGPVFVNPKYTGHRLQYQMLQMQDEYCKKIGYKYAVTTIHPDNLFSINNFIKDGFLLKDTKEFKRGIRNIYFKELI